jgi:predicted metal-dependent enzyme (double-stranded beta helix superfamily)
MFDLDQFVADCRAALAQDSSYKSVREVVARAVSNPTAVIKGLGEPKRGQIQKLYHTDDLTILNVIWAPRMTLYPHNHQMWAVIGVYSGREDNIFWRRVPGSPNGTVQAAGAKSLSERDAEPLGRDIIHSVTNPIPRLTGAIHVYGGDFFNASRSEWDPETLREQRCDVDRIMQLFEEQNALYAKHLVPVNEFPVSSSCCLSWFRYRTGACFPYRRSVEASPTGTENAALGTGYSDLFH